MKVLIFSFLLSSFFSLPFFGQTSIYPTEDTYIRGGSNVSTNYGSSDVLEIKTAYSAASFSRRTLLKYTLSEYLKTVDKKIINAILMVNPEEISSPFPVSVYLINDGWSESNVTWSNAPLKNTLVNSAVVSSPGKNYSIGITSALLYEINKDSILSLMLQDDSGSDELLKLASYESDGTSPRIIIFTDDEVNILSPHLQSSKIEGYQIKLNWLDQSDNETFFIIQRRLNDNEFQILDTVTFNNTTYIDSNVVAGNIYRYRVKAVNQYTSSSWSNIQVADLSATDVPVAVDNFSGNPISSGRIQLAWDYDKTASGFIISRKIDDAFKVIDTVDYTHSMYVDSFLNPKNDYAYVIEAYNFLGRSESSKVITVTTLVSQNYYFDLTQGSDDYSDNSIETPWKSLSKLNSVFLEPGDSILLKSGQSWKGQIKPLGMGAKGYPIVLCTYDGNDKAMINGDGLTGAVIHIHNSGFWHIDNLEITNTADNQESRIGILISADDGIHKHFRLRNLHIHDISGRYSFEIIGKNTGGIGIIGENNARFDDILIENCEINNITRVGIFTNGNNGSRGDRPITNLIIRKNTISYCAGDGIIVRYAHRPLIEHNIAFENHYAPEELVKYGVAIWVRSTDEAIMQYNIVYNTRGSMDGQAFDADLDAYRTVVQYNYTFNNEGGFMLIYGSSKDAIVRYNISQNDGKKGGHLLDFPIWTTPRGSGIIHNNVFYIGPGIDAVLVDEALNTAKMYNNIVINEGNGKLFIPSEGQTALFSNNCLVGYSSIETAVNQNPVNGDPKLTAPGSGEFDFESLDGYKLSESSPCINAALSPEQMGGSYWLENTITDFWGNEIDATTMDVGVHEKGEPVAFFNNFKLDSTYSLKVYPVPFSDHLYSNINVAKKTDIEIKLYNNTGLFMETLYNGILTPGTNNLLLTIDSSLFSIYQSNLYFLRFSFDNKVVYHSKIIKQ